MHLRADDADRRAHRDVRDERRADAEAGCATGARPRPRGSARDSPMPAAADRRPAAAAAAGPSAATTKPGVPDRVDDASRPSAAAARAPGRSVGRGAAGSALLKLSRATHVVVGRARDALRGDAPASAARAAGRSGASPCASPAPAARFRVIIRRQRAPSRIESGVGMRMRLKTGDAKRSVISSVNVEQMPRVQALADGHAHLQLAQPLVDRLDLGRLLPGRRHQRFLVLLDRPACRAPRRCASADRGSARRASSRRQA